MYSDAMNQKNYLSKHILQLKEGKIICLKNSLSTKIFIIKHEYQCWKVFFLFAEDGLHAFRA